MVQVLQRPSQRLSPATCLALTLLAAAPVRSEVRPATSIREAGFVGGLVRLAVRAPGSLGACVLDGARSACVNGDRPYPMQSVMKLLFAFAAFDAADRGILPIDGEVIVRREDLSVYVQPVADLVGASGFRTMWRDLARRAVIDSDSAATDVLLARLGGPRAVQRVLDGKGLRGLRIDRNERDLQTEIVGLTWRPDFVDPRALDQAIARVPLRLRRAAFRAYVADARDTATPRAMASFLHRLARGELLTQRSTADLLGMLRDTRTFPGRLRAGAPKGWSVAHKTGTSGAFEGVTAATNDIGLYFRPSEPPIALAVFLARSRATLTERDAVIAQVGALAATSAR